MCDEPHVIVLPAEDPEHVRAREGFNPKATWYSPRKKRPAAFAMLDGNPDEAQDGFRS